MLEGLICCCVGRGAVEALNLFKASSMLWVLVSGNTGVLDKEPGTGSRHVLSISSSFLLTFWST